jgi:hypothetical protein
MDKQIRIRKPAKKKSCNFAGFFFVNFIPDAGYRMLDTGCWMLDADAAGVFGEGIFWALF